LSLRQNPAWAGQVRVVRAAGVQLLLLKTLTRGKEGKVPLSHIMQRVADLPRADRICGTGVVAAGIGSARVQPGGPRGTLRSAPQVVLLFVFASVANRQGSMDIPVRHKWDETRNSLGIVDVTKM